MLPPKKHLEKLWQELKKRLALNQKYLLQTKSGFLKEARFFVLILYVPITSRTEETINSYFSPEIR